MALGVCRECGKEVSDSARKCPHCGAPKPTAAKKPVSAGMGCLVIFGALVVLGLIMSPSGDTVVPASPAPTPPPPDPLVVYRDSLDLEIVSWQRGGFENVMIASFRVGNQGSREVSDVRIHCDLSAESGTQVSQVGHTVLRVFPPGRATRVNDVNMGFINSQSRQAGCRIIGFRF